MGKRVILLVACMFLMVGGCCEVTEQINVEAEKAAISAVIHDNIGWAATKDTATLYNSVAKNDSLFWFSPRDDGTVRGFQAFTELVESFFMREEFKAVRYEIRELEITVSQSGTVAWYHARLDDYNEWNGQPANWEDVRWTGVLEKRENRWVIVQMHFSSPTDRS